LSPKVTCALAAFFCSSSTRRHTRSKRDWSSDVCSSDLTNPLDLESITAVNDGLKKFKGSIIFTSHDLEFINTISNTVLDISSNTALVKEIGYEDYLIEKGIIKK